jgi:hypothetical protein
MTGHPDNGLNPVDEQVEQLGEEEPGVMLQRVRMTDVDFGICLLILLPEFQLNTMLNRTPGMER